MKLTEYWRLRYRDPHTGDAAAPSSSGLAAAPRHHTESVQTAHSEARRAMHKDFEDTMPRVFHPELMG